MGGNQSLQDGCLQSIKYVISADSECVSSTYKCKVLMICAFPVNH